MNYLVGSGWYSDINNETELGILTNKHQSKYGTIKTKESNFSKYWLSCILKQSIQPIKICILDANSPTSIDNDVKNHNLIEISKQIKNFGHGVYCSKNNILCGWARSFIYGAMQAYINNLDYVYIEQDLLIFGDEFIKNVFTLMNEKNKKICYLTGEETPQKLQQSLVFVKYEYLSFLISELINYKDNTIAEELKHYRLFKDDIMWCPYKGGRQRKKLDATYYCLQHLKDNELLHIIDNFKLLI